MSKRLVELVNLWDRYTEDQPDLEMKDFCLKYLAESKHFSPEEDPAGVPLDGQLIGLSNRLNRFANMYSKKALVHSSISNLEDWVYLITLNFMDQPKKSELITELISEFPSGIDVIKRLLKEGLAEEFPDLNDKRSKRLKITIKGQEVLYGTLEYMNQISHLAFGPLSLPEKQLFLTLLQKLDKFHLESYKTTRPANFDEVVSHLKSKLS